MKTQVVIFPFVGSSTGRSFHPTAEEHAVLKVKIKLLKQRLNYKQSLGRMYRAKTIN